MKDIIFIAVRKYQPTGLTTDGTVVATGNNSNGQRDTLDWVNMIALAAGDHNTVGIKFDATVVVVGRTKNNQANT